jgi:hypothetical protein
MFTPSPPGINALGLPVVGSPVFQQQSMSQPRIDPTPTVPPETDFDRSIDYYADYSGCGHWRMIWPGHVLNAHQKAVIHGSTMMCLDERYYANTLSVRLQRQATETQLRFVKLLREFSNKHNFRILYEIDDIVFHEDIPDYNKFKTAFIDPKIRECANAIMNEVDEITVTNQFMQEYYKEKTGNKNITVIPNYPPKWWIGNYYHERKVMRNYTKHRKKPRIVYCASGAHFDVENRVNQRDDFFHVNHVINNTVNDFQWVFLGAFPLSLRPLVASGQIEFHEWKRLYEYPPLLASLEATMLIAPLQDNTFNRAKSDLKYIEACCYGLPIACQDMCTYNYAPIKFRTGDELIDQIKATVKYRDTYLKASNAARAVADTRWLELDGNIDKYAELYKHPYGSSERKLLNSLDANK